MSRLRLSYRYGVRGLGGKLLCALLLLTTPATADEIVIGAFGDSLTHGYGLPREDGFVPQLEGWLQGRGHDVRVINFGVSGDTTAGGLARIDWTLNDDLDAMIVALGGNDLLRGIDPAASRANLDGILQATGDLPVLLVGLRAFNNFGVEFQTAYDAMYPALAQDHGAVFYPDFLDAVSGIDTAGREGFLPRYIQADGLHPNSAGVARIIEAIGPSVEALIARVPQS